MISSTRLAWLQLRRQKVRLAIALSGVAFAVILMFMQLGFQDALFRSAVTFHNRLRGDLFLFYPEYNALPFPTYFPRVRLYQALGFDGVESVTPVYVALDRLKNPETGASRALLVVGVDPTADVFDSPEVREHLALIRQPDVVLFDRLSRPEYGPITALFRTQSPLTLEVANRDVDVRGLFEMGTSFGVDGTFVTSDLNFLRINPHLQAGKVTIGVIRVKPGADVATVEAELRDHLPHDVVVRTKQEMLDHEIEHWARATPIGFVFAFGVVMGLVVGMIIVYQILFADIADHLKEYATLKAMGYTDRYLVAVVLVEALILAAGGFLPGLAICDQLYGVTRNATGLPMNIELLRATEVLGLTLLMCSASALIAVRKLRAADPADVF